MTKKQKLSMQFEMMCKKAQNEVMKKSKESISPDGETLELIGIEEACCILEGLCGKLEKIHENFKKLATNKKDMLELEFQAEHIEKVKILIQYFKDFKKDE